MANKLRDLFDPTPEQLEKIRERVKQIENELIKTRCCTFCQNSKHEPHIEHGRYAGEDCICNISGEMRFYPEDNGKNCEFWELRTKEVEDGKC